MSHGHSIDKCKCGAIIMQCRCYSNNKKVNIVQDHCDECRPKDTRDQDMVLMSRLCKERNLLAGKLAEVSKEIVDLEKKITKSDHKSHY